MVLQKTQGPAVPAVSLQEVQEEGISVGAVVPGLAIGLPTSGEWEVTFCYDWASGSVHLERLSAVWSWVLQRRVFKSLGLVVSLSLSLSFFFQPHHAACGILVPRPGIEPGAPALRVPSPNHWTTREFSVVCF